MKRLLIAVMILIMLSGSVLSQVPNYPDTYDTTASFPNWKGNRATYLTASLSSGATTISVADEIAWWPTGEMMIIQIGNEKISATKTNATTLAVVNRGLNITATSHPIFSAVRSVWDENHWAMTRSLIITLQKRVGLAPGAISWTPTTTGQILCSTAGTTTEWVTPATCGITAYSLAIGNSISGGGANRVLFQDGSQNLGSSANFTFDGRLTLTSTTEQLRTRYDASNYFSTTVGSTGVTTLDAVGTAPNFQFSDNVGIGVAPAYAFHVSGGTQFSNGNGQSHLPYTDGNIYLSAPAIHFRNSSNSTHSFLDATGLYLGGNTTPTAKLQVLSTTEQFRVLYDGSNMLQLTVGSAGLATFEGVGSGAGFRFEDKIERKINTASAYAHVGGKVAQFLTDATTASQSYENLYTYSMPANMFSRDGDSVEFEFGGTLAANANGKLAMLRVNTTDICQVDMTGVSGVSWRLVGSAIRVSSSALRVTCNLSYGTDKIYTEYAEVGSLTFSNAYDLAVRVRTPDQAGDVTARLGWVKWSPGV